MGRFRCFEDRLRLKCDGTRAETRFRLSPKLTSLFKPAGASVQSTTVSRRVRISGNNARYTMFRGSVKSTGYPLHSPVSPSLPLPCVTVCHQVSTGLYKIQRSRAINMKARVKFKKGWKVTRYGAQNFVYDNYSEQQSTPTSGKVKGVGWRFIRYSGRVLVFDTDDPVIPSPKHPDRP